MCYNIYGYFSKKRNYMRKGSLSSMKIVLRRSVGHSYSHEKLFTEISSPSQIRNNVYLYAVTP